MPHSRRNLSEGHAACGAGCACPPHAEGTVQAAFINCLSSDKGEFINLYANMHEQAPVNSAGVDVLPAAPILPQSVPAPGAQQLPYERA